MSLKTKSTTARHRLPALLLALMAATACERLSPTAPSTGVGSPAATDAGAAIYETERVFCVEEINRLRAQVGRPALHRSAELESFSDQVAQHDATVRQPHAFFRNTNGGGVARAETEILWWRGYAIQQVIKKGLAQMWQVGPGGDHYEVLTGGYSEVGCGVFVNGTEVTVAQDFR